jgi:polyisoprenoid-binding protein YceI
MRCDKEVIMNGPSMTAPALLDLMKGGTLTGEWVLDPRNSSVRLKSKSMGLIPVKGIFREVSGIGTVSPDGTATGTLLDD